MNHVWDNAEAGGNELLVLLALADHADDDGVCWPGIKRIAMKARISERSVKRIVQKLQRSGQLDRQTSAGPKGTNLYRIQTGGDNLSPGTNPAGGGDTQGQKGVTPVSPEPSVQTSKKTSTASRSCSSSIVDEEYIKNLYKTLDPEGVDLSVEKCKVWIKSKWPRVIPFTQEALTPFLKSNASPRGQAAPAPNPVQIPPYEWIQSLLTEKDGFSVPELLGKPWEEIPNYQQAALIELYTDHLKKLRSKNPSNSRPEAETQQSTQQKAA